MNPTPRKKEKFLPAVGEIVGRLTVIAEVEPGVIPSTGQPLRRVRCRCECGKEFETDLASIRRKRAVISCGCARASHGMSRTPTYYSWEAMVQRGTNAANKPHYAKRGIGICERWKSFSNFLADMGERPAGMSIERIDNSKGYYPENCKWAGAKEQARNKETTPHIMFRGVLRKRIELAEEFGISTKTLRYRLTHGWDIEKALTTNPKRKKS
jgi:hypothetical protein